MLFSLRLCICHPQCLISLQVKLDLADERQSAFPLGLRPYVQRVRVRAASHAQLLSLGIKLTGVPAAAALEIELSFDETVLDLGSVKAILCRAGLMSRLCFLRYCCKTVLGTAHFAGTRTPVSVELRPGLRDSLSPSDFQNLMQHNLVELQLTVQFPEMALRDLKSALRQAGRTRGTLRCLQVDVIRGVWTRPEPMTSITTFLSGLKLPRLAHLGFLGGVGDPYGYFPSGCAWPQRESVPMLQSFGSTRTPADIFGICNSGVHLCFEGASGGALCSASMAAMASSGLGPAIRELHLTMRGDAGTLWPSAMGLLKELPSVRRLSLLQDMYVEDCWRHLRAEDINALDGLQDLALGHVMLDGDLTGPCLTQIVCLRIGDDLHPCLTEIFCEGLHKQIPALLVRPPAALVSILVPQRFDGLEPERCRCWDTVLACPGGPCWKLSHESSNLWDWHDFQILSGLVKAVPCKGWGG